MVLKMYKKIVFIICIFLSMILMFSACGQNSGNNNPIEQNPPQQETPLPPATVYVQTINNRVKGYLEDSYQNIAKHVVAYSSEMIDDSKPLSIRLDWSKEVKDKNYSIYTLWISQDEEFKTNTNTYVTSNSYFDVSNLYINTKYFWKVEANGWQSEVQAIYTDVTAPRLIDVEGVTNMRDIGGYKTNNSSSENKIVNQGLIYRSGKLDNITEQGRGTAKNDLSIKTEIDLRREEDGATRDEGENNSYLGAGVYYYKCPMDWNYLSTENVQSVQKIFQILSNKDNYPVVFHCTAGADRTGFIAYCINALLGVEKEDLYDDYQITNFAKQSERERYYSGISSYVSAIDSTGGKTLSEKAFNFLVDDKFVDPAHLRALQNIMFEKVT